MQLNESLQAWGNPEFEAVFKRELAAVPVDVLPLQQGMRQGGYVLDELLTVTLLSTHAEADVIRVNAGVFFSSIIPGCSCADDPTPVEPINEYCEVQVAIDRRTGEASARLSMA